MPEEMFWRDMNPARLIALYNAAFPPRSAPQQREEEPKSLSEYLRGG